VPVLARSRPAMTISRLVSPEPDGPTRPTVLLRPTTRSMPRRNGHRPRAGQVEMHAPEPDGGRGGIECGHRTDTLRGFSDSERLDRIWRHGADQSGGALVGGDSARLAGGAAAAACGATLIRLLVLGDSLTAGWRGRKPAWLERALAAEGLAMRVSSANSPMIP
jgi:hypothetical protein